MIALLVVAMIGGTLFSIVWSIVWPNLRVSMVVGSMEPPGNANVDERGRYYKEVLDKAIKNKLPERVIGRAAINYASWLLYEKWNHREAKKAYDRCVTLCEVKGADCETRTIQADAMIRSGSLDHLFYLQHEGPPPDPQKAILAQKAQVEAAKEMGFTNDANDVERQRRTQEAICIFFCDNKQFSKAAPYASALLDRAKKNSADVATLTSAMVLQARVLSGLGQTKEADKLFGDAIKLADTTYGGGSDESEWCLHRYSDPLICDGRVEFGNSLKSQQDDERVW